MRILSLPLGDDLIEIHNSVWTGEEKVYFNGQLASTGRSFFGRNHYFTVDRVDGQGIDKFRVEISMTWFGSIAVDIFHNDRCLLASSKTPISRVDGRLLEGGDTKPYHIRREGDRPELDDEFFV
jgi:hypothetical protein